MSKWKVWVPVIFGLTFALNILFPQFGNDNFVASVSIEMSACQKNGSPDKCYQDLAKKLLSKMSLRDSLESLRRIEAEPDALTYCHNVTHFLGREAYQEKGSLEEVYSECNSVCFAGCYHGAVEQYFNDKSLAIGTKEAEIRLSSELTDLCLPAGGRKGKIYRECVHGLGHALMLLTGADLPRSLELCNAMGSQIEKRICYTGVFMENSSSATNSSHPSKFVNPDEPLYPCSVLEDKYHEDCYLYQGSYFFLANKPDWKKVADLCQKIPREYHNSCFRFVGMNLVEYTGNLVSINDICSLFPGDGFRQECQKGVVTSLHGRFDGDLSRVLDFCKVTGESDRRNCYNQMGAAISYWHYELGNPASWAVGYEVKKAECLRIQELQYQEVCLNSHETDTAGAEVFN